MWQSRKNKRYRRNKYVKKHRSTSRNFDDPAYKRWRKEVFQRDGWVCKYPGCGCKKSIQAHHILTWAEYPALRFNIQNGITLCRKHHDMIKGRESAFVKIFHEVLLKGKRGE